MSKYTINQIKVITSRKKIFVKHRIGKEVMSYNRQRSNRQSVKTTKSLKNKSKL